MCVANARSIHCPKWIIFSMEQCNLLLPPLYSCLAFWRWAVAVTVAVVRALVVSSNSDGSGGNTTIN
jgi:hypothetical protein